MNSKAPKPNQQDRILELTVEKLVPGGDGMARLDGKVVFIPAALPGERVRVRLFESKKDFARAEVLEILSSSPSRQEPPCPVAKICGGCDWQHIEYTEQLRQKIALTQDALKRTGGITFPGLIIEAWKPLGYRNRVQIHRDTQGRSGFLAKASHTIVPVNSCPVAHPALNILFAQGGTDTLLEANALDAKADSSAMPLVPKPSLTKALTTPNPGGLRFPAWAHTPSESQADFLISGEAGSAYPGFSVKILDREIQFDLRCFFQSNVEMLAKLLPYTLEGLGGVDGLKGKEAMDLYCGVGLFGAFLQDRFDRVLAVEENTIALDYARKNMGPQNIFLNGKIEDLIEARASKLMNFHPEVIVVDPPRPGLDKGVQAFLLEQNPQRLIYVSCNPVTLARDLKILLAGGYQLEDLRLFDFYPQTPHVEAVAKLKKA
jgi:23S rRNA (uracil1939-C5)-methyltransferase